MATPSILAFDAEGRAIDFDVWLDDLQLFLQCDRADGLSLFDLTSGASPAPAADANTTVRSQWAIRDAAARLAVRRHLPTSERAHFSQYKSAQTLYDAVVARYSSPATDALSRLMLPREEHSPVGASRGDPRTPVFEGCSPSPLLPSVASAAAADLVGFESVGAASAPSGRRRTGVVAEVEVSLVAVEAEAAAAVAVGAEVAEVEEAAAEEVELVGVALRRGSAPVVRGGGTGPCT
ncbi:unnamed protein product [Closterium sp. NIES-64]|nr:unnamed protein product [Closterium sp. NIES-64]